MSINFAAVIGLEGDCYRLTLVGPLADPEISKWGEGGSGGDSSV